MLPKITDLNETSGLFPNSILQPLSNICQLLLRHVPQCGIDLRLLCLERSSQVCHLPASSGCIPTVSANQNALLRLPCAEAWSVWVEGEPLIWALLCLIATSNIKYLPRFLVHITTDYKNLISWVPGAIVRSPFSPSSTMAAFGVNSTGHEVVQAFGTHLAGKIGIVLLDAINDYVLTIPVLITGPSKDGIGAELAKTLAIGDLDHLLLAGRNEAKITPVITEIQKMNSNIKVTYVQCDLLDNESVRKAAARVNSLVQKIDILINNAGIMAARTFRKSADGVESQFAAGYLGHFLLTNLIMDKIVAARGVIINMTSSAYMLDEVDTHDPNFEVNENPMIWRGVD